jgi:hypothetical protein
LKRILILGLVLAAGTIAVIAFAQPGVDDYYKPAWDKLKQDITAQAPEVAIEPKFRAVADDHFAYEIDFRATRSGTVTQGSETTDAFRRTEHWTTAVHYKVEEEELEGHKDLRLAMRYDRMTFLLDNGKNRYAGYIGPDQGQEKAGFFEVQPGGARTSVGSIPGWPGVNAQTIKSMSDAQNRTGSAWFSVSEQSRLYGETYFADYNSADQRNYPGRFQDPVHLTLALFPQFAEDAKVKIGEVMTVRRRMPMGAAAGATVEYDVTYKLEKLYGTVEEPVGARFSFSATPAKREQEARVEGLTVRFSAPDLKDGALFLDLAKGVPLYTRWSYTVKGAIGGEASAIFENEVEFTASLRADRTDAE